MADTQGEAHRIGELLRQARVLRGRSQADVAADLGYHQSKISRLEGGRGTEDIRVLREVARVLRIPPAHLGLAETALEAEPDDPETEDMLRRRTLLAASVTMLATPVPAAAAHPALVQALLPGALPASMTEPPSAEQLRQRAMNVRRLLTTCDYAKLERTLPGLITDLRQAASSSAQPEEVSGFLATAYQTSASLFLKRGDAGTAWLAVGRAMAEAERFGDPLVLAASVRLQAHVLVREQHARQAVTLIQHTASQLTGSYDRRSPHHLAVLGLLLLRGVTAASRAGDRAATSEFVAEAKEVAQYIALDQPDVWANFSPTNVTLHQISAAVSFGDAGIALDAARPLMRRHIPVPERRAALWIETARAYAQQGRLADGYQALRIAETCAAQDVRRPAVRELVADMAARDRRRTLPELHHFSRRLGVPA
ncbi:helix-turn-helix domain-containing protein [Streptomyces sp. NBC_00291]|uniref:helix-turn-helix domain-containing protein n=1 Tax=Streptomyces sp. NBC_00291 TaxID=2975704 RepID=UPI00225285E1|nr:helix-turn-helix transcriptional regulator [Streptomyces sp. NBC_00291]MCX5153832.1 helix-turn-helix domain-containing protein [Streptomyces sp. NBC_00291]